MQKQYSFSAEFHLHDSDRLSKRMATRPQDHQGQSKFFINIWSTFFRSFRVRDPVEGGRYHEADGHRGLVRSSNAATKVCQHLQDHLRRRPLKQPRGKVGLQGCKDRLVEVGEDHSPSAGHKVSSIVVPGTVVVSLHLNLSTWVRVHCDT